MPLDVHDAALLHDMLASARQTLRYLEGRTRADLDSDPMLGDAVVRRIEIIGEAAPGLSDAFHASHPLIPWRPIIAPRHILAHEYADVSHDIIWRIVREHLPPLIQQLEVLLATSPPESSA